MQHKNVIMAVERTLRDIRGCESLLGGLPVVFGFDFAQFLPIVRNAQRPWVIDACIQCTTYWRQLTVLCLTQNMRFPPDARNRTWAWWIKNMSYQEHMYGEVSLQPDVSSDKQFVDEAFLERVFPLAELQNPNRPETFSMDREAFAHQNESVTKWNDMRLHLALRDGLCNGTRGIVQRGRNIVVMIKIVGCNIDGNVYAISRRMLRSSEGELTYIINGRQFLVRLRFAMPINKARGNSPRHARVDSRSLYLVTASSMWHSRE